MIIKITQKEFAEMYPDSAPIVEDLGITIDRDLPKRLEAENNKRLGVGDDQAQG